MPEAAARSAASRPEPETALDPVCGMQVEVATARHTAEVDGALYYFCCANCRARFVKEPQLFRAPSVVSQKCPVSTEAADAPGWQGATTENIGRI